MDVTEFLTPSRYPILSKIRHRHSPPATVIEWPGGRNFHQVFHKSAFCPDPEVLKNLLDDIELTVGSDQKPDRGDVDKPRQMGGLKHFSALDDVEHAELLWLRKPYFDVLAKTPEWTKWVLLAECTLIYRAP